jgi:long-subunit acyl-CoA synthetase (AMP-forming)
MVLLGIMKQKLNFNDFLLHVLDSHPNKTAFSIYRKGLKSFSYLETLNLTFEILDQIRALKPGPKDKIALVLDSSPEYAATFFATALLNIPLVLIDPKINVNEMKCILDHSDAKIIACGHSTVGIANKLVSQSENKAELCLVDNLVPKNRTAGELKELISAYKGLDLNDQALLVYTSGTTSNAKGVMRQFALTKMPFFSLSYR